VVCDTKCDRTVSQIHFDINGHDTDALHSAGSHGGSFLPSGDQCGKDLPGENISYDRGHRNNHLCCCTAWRSDRIVATLLIKGSV